MTFKQMGWAKRDGLNCRIRSTFQNDEGAEMFIEVSSAPYFDKKKKGYWMVVNYLFYTKDDYYSMSKELNPIIDKYYKMKLPYNIQSLKTILKDVGVSNPKIVIDKNEKQLSLWE